MLQERFMLIYIRIIRNFMSYTTRKVYTLCCENAREEENVKYIYDKVQEVYI